MALKEVQRTARRQAVSQTRTRALGIDTRQGDQRGEIMSALSKFAQAGSAEANRQQKAEIETRRALGASRAAQDLLVTEEHRQGITEDDKLATKLAYNAIIGQHETMEAGNSFAEWYQSNPAATPEEIEKKKTELYQPMFEKYGGDERSLKQISLQVQESQFKLLPIQERIKADYTKQKNAEALTMSMGDMLADPNVDVNHMLDTEIPARAKALGISEFDMKKLMLSEMKTRAADGDGRLLEGIENRDWAKELEITRTARVTYDKKHTVDNATALAKDMASTETSFLSGDMTEAALLKKVDTMNTQYGDNVYSKEYVRSLLMRRQAADAKRAGDNTVIQDYYSRKHIIPMGVDTSLSEADKGVIQKAKEQQWVDMTNKLIAGGMSETEANAKVMGDKIKWSATEQIILPDLKAQLASLMSFDPTIAKQDEGMMSRWEHSSETLQQMPPALLRQYLGKDADYALNVKQNMKSMGVYEAFSTAYRDKYNPITITKEDRTSITSSIDSAVDDAFKSGVFARTFLGGTSATEEQRDIIKSDLSKRGMELYRSGIRDEKVIADTVLSEYRENNTQLPNGSIANINSGKLATQLTAGTKTQISQTQAVEYADAWLTKYASTKSSWSGESVDKSDLVLQFNQDGSSFVVKNKYGMLEDQGITYLTNQIFEVARPEDLAKTKETLEDAYHKRKQEVAPIHAYERHGFFY